MRGVIISVLAIYALNVLINIANAIIDAMPFWLSAIFACVVMAGMIIGFIKLLMVIEGELRGQR